MSPTTNGFAERLYALDSQADRLVYAAKHYCVAHWQQVSDWTDLHLNITQRGHGPGNHRAHGIYGPERGVWGPKVTPAGRRIFDGMQLGAVENVTDVVLDESDGDFSVTVNGTAWYWINDSAVAELADYIQAHLPFNPHF